MPKKRKTKQEKIILQLKRELESRKTEPRQEAISRQTLKLKPKKTKTKKTDNVALSIQNKAVKKDLIRSLVLTLAIFSLELVLYLRLR